MPAPSTSPLSNRLRLGGLLTSGTALYFFANIQRVAVPGSIFDLLQSELHVSAPYITALGSAFMYVYALNQLLIGLLVDRYGGARVTAIGSFFFCFGSLLFPFSGSLFMLYFSWAMIGLGASSIYLSLVNEVMRHFNKNFTIMLSVVILIGYLGGIMANAPFVAGVGLLGWRMMLKLVALVSIVFYLLFLAAEKTSATRPIQKSPFRLQRFATLLKKRHNRDLFLFSGLNFGLYYVLQTVLGKKFLEDFCLMSNDRAAMVLSVMAITSAFSGLISAVLSRLANNRRQIFLRISGLMCGSVFLVITGLILFEIRTPWIALFLCLLAFTASTSSIAIPLLRETNEPDVVGAAVSVMNFCFYISVALFGNAVGFLMNLFKPEPRNGLLIYSSHSYLAVFGFLFILSGLVVFHAWRLRETMGRNVAESTA